MIGSAYDYVKNEEMVGGNKEKQLSKDLVRNLNELILSFNKGVEDAQYIITHFDENNYPFSKEDYITLIKAGMEAKVSIAETELKFASNFYGADAMKLVDDFRSIIFKMKNFIENIATLNPTTSSKDENKLNKEMEENIMSKKVEEKKVEKKVAPTMADVKATEFWELYRKAKMLPRRAFSKLNLASINFLTEVRADGNYVVRQYKKQLDSFLLDPEIYEECKLQEAYDDRIWFVVNKYSEDEKARKKVTKLNHMIDIMMMRL